MSKGKKSGRCGAFQPANRHGRSIGSGSQKSDRDLHRARQTSARRVTGKLDPAMGTMIGYARDQALRDASTSIFGPKTWGARSTTVGRRSDLRVEAFVGRGSRIRTCDLKYPKLPRYQAALYPVIWAVWLSCETAADKGAEARGLPQSRRPQRLRFAFR